MSTLYVCKSISLQLHNVYCQPKYLKMFDSTIHHFLHPHKATKDAHNWRRLLCMLETFSLCAHFSNLFTCILIRLHVCAALCNFMEIAATTAHSVFNNKICTRICVC